MEILTYSKVPNKRVYSTIIFIFFPHPTPTFSTLFVYLGLLFYEICSKYPPYLFIWDCSFMKFAQNIHPTRLFGPTRLIGPWEYLLKLKLIAGKFTWGVKANHCWALSTTFLFSKECWHHPAMFCLITSSKLSRQLFEFSLMVKVMWSNPGYLLKFFLPYLHFFSKRFHEVVLKKNSRNFNLFYFTTLCRV